MPFNSSGWNIFFAWIGFVVFLIAWAVSVVYLDWWIRFKIKNRKKQFKRQDPITEFYETLKQKI